MKDWERTLEQLAARGLRRSLRPQGQGAGPEVELQGRRLINLASNNYLGLATDIRLIRAAQQALERWGVGAGASRLLTGNCAIHEQLEAALASFKQTEGALVFTSGYAANVGVLAALAGPRDTICADALNHASLIDGCRLSHARLHVYRHGDLDQLEGFLRAAPARGQRLIVSDSIFSMDGDLAPLAELAELAERWSALLIVDDAHGTGVLGATGSGAAEHFGLSGRIHVQIGTLSKALGVQGGFVAGSRSLIELLLHRARPFIYSTGMAPALAAAALAALEIVGQEPWRRTAQRRHLARLRAGLAAAGFALAGQDAAPMTAVLVGAAEQASAMAARLEQAGVLAPAIRPPTVPEGTSRIRLAPMASHTDQQIDQVLERFAGLRGAL